MRNARSYSSASTTNSSSPAIRALPPQAATRPPAIPVGARPIAASASVVITVVVVFPWVPLTPTTVFPATSSASAAFRGTTGIPSARARASSGWSADTAAVCTTARAPSTCAGACPRSTGTPSAARSAAPLGSVSHPVTTTPRRRAIEASALIPAPPIPTK